MKQGGSTATIVPDKGKEQTLRVALVDAPTHTEEIGRAHV